MVWDDSTFLTSEPLAIVVPSCDSLLHVMGGGVVGIVNCSGNNEDCLQENESESHKLENAFEDHENFTCEKTAIVFDAKAD